MTVRLGVLLLAMVAMAACSNRDIRLRDMSTNRSTPEEFAIVPYKPLAQPESFAALPPPTPGGANRTDQTPLADAVAVLGGNPARLNSQGGIPAGEAALVQSASRYGVDGNIRQVLAEEDLAFRKRRSLFNWRLIKDDEYNKAYDPQRLDAAAVLWRYRNAGAQTPSAPPDAK